MAQTKDAAIKIVQAALRSDRDFETYKPQIIQKIKASDEYISFLLLCLFCCLFEKNFLFHCSKNSIFKYQFVLTSS